MDSSTLLALIFPQLSLSFFNPLLHSHETDSSKCSKRLHTVIIGSAAMLYSDSLLYFCSLLIFKHGEFLVRSIDLYPGDSCPSREMFRDSPLRCTPGYRHNDITALIIGKPNSYDMRSFSWALSDVTGQEFGFALDGKMAGGGIEVDMIRQYAVMSCTPVLRGNS